MFRSQALFVLLIFQFINESFGVYGRVPGERYLDFLKTLTEEQRSLVRGIIFDPHLTKDQAIKVVGKWAYEQSPLTMQAYDRSQMDYDILMRRNERILNRREKDYSKNAKLLDMKIREIYRNGTLTEREACDTAANVMKIADPSSLLEIGLEELDCDQTFTSIFD